jgi:copper chaperone CopZ/bacterioferritin-associated ferredoxin
MKPAIKLRKKIKTQQEIKLKKMFKTITLPIKGMSCSSCSRSVEKQVENLDGLVEKHVDHDADSGEFTIDETMLSTEALIQAINKGHYKVELPEGVIMAEDEKLAPPCPVCNKAGAEVPNTVLRSNLKPDTYKQIELEDDFNICMNSSCNVAYYTTGQQQLINKEELKRELYYKEGSEKQIICYCNNVDKEQIKDTVCNHHITDWDETMAFYSNKVQEKCEILNPTGLCCRELFDEVVQEIKESDTRVGG